MRHDEDDVDVAGEPGPVAEPAPHTPEHAPHIPDPVRHSDRVLIVGKTEGGKSTLARHLALGFTGSRMTFIDPKDGEWRLEGVEPARDPAALDLQAPVSHYIPSSLSDEEYEDLFERLWWARGPRVIWLDECFGPTRKGYAPHHLRLIIQQGAKHDVGLIACTQRPVNIESTLRTEAEHVFLFVPPPPMLDLRTLAGDMGQEPETLKREMHGLLEQEGLFSHLWYCRRTHGLHFCAPLDAAWAV